MSLIIDARTFALKKHEGFFRPNKMREPYSIHITEVAELVEAAGGPQEEIAAAWLHDTVEDTDTTVEEIREKFGATVALIVLELTDHDDLKTLPTLKRKMVQAERLRGKGPSIKRVKLADGTSNLRSVALDPPTDWDLLNTLDYINGCGLVAYQCRGLSDYLDQLFYEAYRAAMLAHL